LCFPLTRFKSSPETIKDIDIEMTVIGGRIVFEKAR
jgi:predicted amidohydrolase YtcJ